MSSIASDKSRAASEAASTYWLAELLGVPLPAEGGSIESHGLLLTMRDGILRGREFVSRAQAQTADVFGYKWARRDTYEGEPLRFSRQWLLEKYGDVSAAPWLFATSENPILLDAGCGAAVSALALFEPVLNRIRYLGVDISAAVDVARARFAERQLCAAFMQVDLNRIPLPDDSVDIVFAEGVLHHTDDTRGGLAALVRLLKRGGHILFYVYRRKGPIREFSDDYIREKLQAMSPEEAWRAIMPLTRLGKTLGELDIDIDVPEAIDLLDIPAGRINLQRFFYWHICKLCYRPEMSLEEMNYINFDWYSPKNAHRHTPEEVRRWCNECGLKILHERVEEAGITIVAQRER